MGPVLWPFAYMEKKKHVKSWQFACLLICFWLIRSEPHKFWDDHRISKTITWESKIYHPNLAHSKWWNPESLIIFALFRIVSSTHKADVNESNVLIITLFVYTRHQEHSHDFIVKTKTQPASVIINSIIHL